MAAELKVAVLTEIKIEKGVPFPSSSQGSKNAIFASMEINDSIHWPLTKEGMFSSVQYYNAKMINSGSPKRFKCSSRGGENRVWRIA